MVQVGLVGTGFVAKRRAEALAADGRGHLVAVAGHTAAETATFAQTYGATPLADWPDLVHHPEIELVMVCHINRDHGAVAAAALAAGKHVVVEYPLALNWLEAQDILTLAKEQKRLLHVEHIELLGGTHRAAKENLAALGTPQYARYCTLSPKHPAPASWTYCPELFGFPLVGALSRLHRMIDCFGPVERVYGQNSYGGLGQGKHGLNYYTACVCLAQLTFTSGVRAEVVYGKGETIWAGSRRFEAYGSEGQLILDGEQGSLTNAEGSQAIEVGSRRGLFAADTGQVLDHLLTGEALYCTPEASLYSLRVASAIQESAATGQAVALPPA